MHLHLTRSTDSRTRTEQGFRAFLFDDSCAAIQDASERICRHVSVINLVLMTSNGVVTNPVIPPAAAPKAVASTRLTSPSARLATWRMQSSPLRKLNSMASNGKSN